MAVKRSIKLEESETEAILNIQKRETLIDQECAEIKKTELSIERRIEAVKGFMSKTEQLKAELGKELTLKYGKGAVDSAKGLFVPQ